MPFGWVGSIIMSLSSNKGHKKLKYTDNTYIIPEGLNKREKNDFIKKQRNKY